VPLGRFLELSVHATDIPASLAFYESLGFVQATVGGAYPHPYAVVTDGRLTIGLHGASLEAPTLTWVAPDLRLRTATLADGGIEFEHLRLDDTALHEATFLDPSGLPVRLLEARTYSPPPLAPGFASALGYFEELAITADDVPASSAFWERLGFVAFDAPAPPCARVVATGRDLNLGLWSLDLADPLLIFSAQDLAQRAASLESRGHALAGRLPRGLRGDGIGLLVAPEGTRLLLIPDSETA
jgi:catechol 2,3-dioxygenase-like lactoylglutathione lyase family enzyme